ncbi:MAG: hypothetical protein HY343_07525 [Lentisphaerae bacterium]|nr:hypothetical protein [Lentisphaerota bacterium]
MQNLNALLRWLATLLGGILISRGLATTEDIAALLANIPALIGSAAAIAAIVWSIWEISRLARHSPPLAGDGGAKSAIQNPKSKIEN